MSTVAAHWPQFDASFPDDPLELPPDRFFNRVQTWLQQRMKPADWDSYWLRINLPLPGEEATSGPWSEQEMAAAFKAAEQAL